ncbi:coiled-coil domain-containing protein 116 isoform X4 [Canis lupus familiaris]|uniref:coiled-coil domain-containing protein 116 isoform X4 n=1 Tax=Canis lupus familiaris TaxID=9615 RepID=UPI0018F3C792|nr:coiled-coil domain-containing protein 116 isoform X4 [Canis lupus familiaris]
MWAGRRRRGGEGLIWVPPPAIVRGAGRPCEPIRTQHVNKQAGQVRVTPELSVRTRERVQTPLTGTQRGADSERNPWLCSGTGEKRRIAGRSTLTMTSCHHHSGYLADDEAGHTTYVARSPNYRFVKKTLPSISSKSTLSHFPNPVYEELVSYLVEKVVSLVIYKYKFEKNLSKQLGFISFPVTETLMDLFLGFKKVKGSRICLSSKINWNCLLRKLEEAEWARQLSRQASQHDSASQRSSQRGPAHQGAGHSSTESPSTGPEPAPRADPAEAAEPSLDSELPDLRLLWAQEDAGAEEQGPTSVGANQSQELVDGDSQSNEEEDEDQGEDFPDEGTPQSSPRASSGGGRQRLHEHESQ